MAVKILVAGEWRESEESIEIRSPFDQTGVGTTFAAGSAMLEVAIEGAAKTFDELRQRSGKDRSRILRAVSEGIRKDADGFARLIALEAGKPLKAANVEVERATFTFGLAAEEAAAHFEQHIDVRMPSPALSRQGTIKWFPAGPVAAITPFNFPLNLVAHKLAPAIAVGCPVVLKPAPQTPLTALKLAKLIVDAGLPAGALSVLPMENDVAAKLVADDRLKVLSFTGSAKVGWELKAKAGKKKVLLELGGNAAVIVEPDADVVAAAARCVTGGFGYSGQSCISVQRIFVHDSVFDDFLARVLDGVRALRSGDPLNADTDCGPLIRESDAVRAESWIRESVAKGANLLMGGKRNGSFIEPAVLTNTKPDDKVTAEEVFGPLVVIERYEHFSEAIAQVNNSRYGLQAGVFTADEKKIDHAFEHLAVGGVIVNDVPTFRSDAMPYGGVKDSGLGREGVRYAMAEMSEMRLLVI
jgi:acyl-CoA reductase-like NAD-dependent aldehyde dehydrogenase